MQHPIKSDVRQVPSSTLAVRVTGKFLLDPASTVSVDTDDGVCSTIDGALIATRKGTFDNTFTSIAGIAAGLHPIDIVFFEHAGSAVRTGLS